MQVCVSLTGAMLDGICPGNSGGTIEGAGEAVGAAMLRLVVVSRTGVTRNQTSAGEMTCRAGDCRRGDQMEPHFTHLSLFNQKNP